MLYLFGTGSYKDGRKALKVGYARDIIEREKAYRLHNPLGEFLAWRDGDRKLEAKLHMRLIDYKEDFLDEWMYDEDPVIAIFMYPEKEIDKWLKENASRVFYPIPLPGTLKREIYDELFGLEPFKGTKFLSDPLFQDDNFV